MAIKDRRALEGMPLKLLIVTLLISLSAPIVLSSLGSFQARTSESQAMMAAEHIRETITATYLPVRATTASWNRLCQIADAPSRSGAT